jgi:hypothetical protein
MSPLGAIILFALGSALSIGSSAYAWWQPGAESTVAAPRPRAALEIFNAEFPHALSYDGGIRMQQGAADVEVRWRVHLDFDANSKYISLFIPQVPPSLDTQEPYHFLMAAQLTENVQDILADMEKTLQISAGGVAQEDVV